MVGFRELLIILAVSAVVLAIWLTSERGRRIARRLGLRGLGRDAAPSEDHAFLLRKCGGDRQKLDALLDEARQRNPEMSEAEAYRRAIRRVVREDGSS